MKRILIPLLIFAAVSAQCAVIKDNGGSYLVAGDDYRAVVNGEGVMTSLIAWGVECLAKDGGCAAKPVKEELNKMPGGKVEAEGAALTVKGEGYTAVYNFGDRNIKISVSGADNLQYAIALRQDRLSRRPDGSWRAPGVSMESFNRFAYFVSGKNNILLSGVFTSWWKITQGKSITLTFRENTAEDVERYKDVMRIYDRELAVYSPCEWRVFQRSSEYNGAVRFEGKTTGDSVKVRLFGKTIKGSFDTGFRTLAVKDGVFSADVPTEAGGWYKVCVRAYKGGKLIKEKTLNRVGVGEVFIGAGQSNSTNSGRVNTNNTTGMVASFDGDLWQPGDDPFWGCHDDSIAGSHYPAFGDAMYKKYKVPIAVASTGHAGSGIGHWLPDAVLGAEYLMPERGNLYDWTLWRMKQLGKGGFRAVLWHQGENDVNIDVDLGYNRMKLIIESSKKDAGWEFPWFVAKVSYLPDKHSSPNIREVHQRLWDTGVALEGPDTDTLTGLLRGFNGTGVHFSPKGMIAHGEIWAKYVSKYLDEIL